MRICGRIFSARNFCVFCEFRGRTLRSLTICVHLCASVGGYSTPEASVNSVNSVGGLAQANSEWFCGKNLEGGVGMAGMPYPPTKTPTDCTDAHRLGGYGIPAIPTQPQNYLPTEFTEHTETTGGEEKSVYICEIRGRTLRSLTICVHL